MNAMTGQTPLEVLQRRMQLAEAMAYGPQQQSNGPVGAGLRGLAQILAARNANKLGVEVAETEKSQRTGDYALLGEMLDSGSIDTKRLGEFQNEQVAQLALALATRQASPEAVDLVEALGPDGKPVFVQKSQAAGMTPYGGSSTAPVGQVPAGQFTPQSLQRFAESGDYSVLERFEPFQSVMIAGVPHILDKSTGAVYVANVAGTPMDAGTVAGMGGTVAAGEEAGKQAIAQSGQAIESLRGVSQSISNIDAAIQAVDDGAKTGVIMSRLPDITAASIELDNVRSRMGLDIVGATTFGALSESELAFALDTALPTRLEPPELRKWLENKKTAQQKLAQELTDAAIFLGKPGNTPAMFLEKKGVEKGKPSAQPAAQDMPADLPPTTGVQEGSRAVNDETGEVYILQGGRWVRGV
jgi:hypothetical protein